jgi:LmbE family N-acetylglucosaminyl deacetylase
MAQNDQRHVYLQPHSDDICFSLGGLADKLHSGILLTIFPISAYVPLVPGVAPPSAEWVTRTRIAEDQAFADSCGLDMRTLQIPCASLLGHKPFDLGWVNENLRRIEAPLIDALMAMVANRVSPARPWLFCPSGIGGHVDHAATRIAVIRNYAQLAPFYRIGFYEDLHYAANAAARNVGINSLSQEMRDRTLQRYAFLLGDGVTRKLALIGHYRSQFLQLPHSIDGFTPAAVSPRAPHEAIWTDPSTP